MPGATKELKQRVVAAIDRAAPTWQELSLRIHAHPELGRDEVKASAWLAEAMEKSGFAVTRSYLDLPTSFLACRGKSGGKPVISYLAEMDALPGMGHACSHNLMGVAACLAGVGLGEVIGQDRAEVRVIGTPAEENFSDKSLLVARGAFNGVDAALMAHGGSKNYAKRDFIGRKVITFEFRGKPAHASAAPQEGINALDAMIQLFNAVGLLRQQIRSESRIHGIITHGGEAANIIPAYTRAEFNVRSFDAVYLNDLERRVIACARGAAEATGTQMSSHTDPNSMMPAKRIPTLEKTYEDNLRFLGVPVDELDPNTGVGSTDFGNVSQVVPGVHAYFAMAPDHVHSHTPEFTVASASPEGQVGMLIAAKTLALTGLDMLEDQALAATIRREFTGR